jgi:hypothetical protein
LWALLELGAMFRIEWLIDRCGYSQGQQLLAAEAKHFSLQPNYVRQLKQLEADSWSLYHPDGPHRNKLQMAPR